MMNRRHFSGLALGLGLTGLPAWAQVKDLNDAINKAGRQRMLSQRVAKAYMALALQAQPAQAEKILSQTMFLFDRQLVESKAFAPSPAIRDTYVKLEGAWSDYKEKLIGKARTEFLAGMPTLGDAPEATGPHQARAEAGRAAVTDLRRRHQQRHRRRTQQGSVVQRAGHHRQPADGAQRRHRHVRRAGLTVNERVLVSRRAPAQTPAPRRQTASRPASG